MLGAADGLPDGKILGYRDGPEVVVGRPDGIAEGDPVGPTDGISLGAVEGMEEGRMVGTLGKSMADASSGGPVGAYACSLREEQNPSPQYTPVAETMAVVIIVTNTNITMARFDFHQDESGGTFEVLSPSAKACSTAWIVPDSIASTRASENT